MPFAPLRIVCLGLAVTLVPAAVADDVPRPASVEANPNLELPTLGGLQFWADLRLHAGWRIQQNVLTGHYRLLDAGDVRRAWGTLAQCEAALADATRRHRLAWPGRHMVILLHGLGRTRKMFSQLPAALRADGFAVAAVGYPSRKRSVPEHAHQIAEVLAHLDGIDTVSFVTHSLGGLVVRELLGRDGRDRAAWPDIDRLVMVGPPNRGAAIADALEEVPPYQWVFGPSGQAVTEAGVAQIPVPDAPFGIIAGGLGDDAGYNPALAGDDDGLVRVPETHLDGAADFLVVPGLHTYLPDHPQTIAAVRRFLRIGRFRPPASER